MKTAIEIGRYENFTGKIDCKGGRGSVKNANFEIKGNKILWEKGIWKKGTWYNGLWKRGVWKDGIWQDGTWNDGTWKDGVWRKGTWLDKKNLAPNLR